MALKSLDVAKNYYCFHEFGDSDFSPLMRMCIIDVDEEYEEPNLEAIRGYIAAHPDEVHHRTKEGYTVLMMAAACGLTDVVKILLEAGADATALSDDKTSALLLVAGSTIFRGNYDCLKLLLDAGAGKTINTVCTYGSYGFTPFTISVRKCEGDEQLEVVKTLIAAGADINLADNTGYTALEYAMKTSRKNNAQIVRLLLDNGADLDSADDKGTTTFTDACVLSDDDAADDGRRADIEIIELMLSYKPKVLVRAFKNLLKARTKFMYSLQWTAYERLIKTMIDLMVERITPANMLEVTSIIPKYRMPYFLEQLRKSGSDSSNTITEAPTPGAVTGNVTGDLQGNDTDPEFRTL